MNESECNDSSSITVFSITSGVYKSSKFSESTSKYVAERPDSPIIRQPSSQLIEKATYFAEEKEVLQSYS